MELSHTRVVPAPPAKVWEALNDPETLKACLPGCEIFERTADGEYRVVIAARVGPVSARFNGKMSMSDVDPPNAYTLHFEGQGGAAGFARGEARVALAPESDAATSLTYAAKAQVGGKLAQIGSRLVDGAAAKLADDFFARFVARLAPAPVAPEPGIAAEEPLAQTSIAAKPTLLTPPGGSAWIRYAAIIAIAIVLILLYLRGYR